jgi:hypothetical protein
MFRKKAQTQAMSLVIITGIIISLVSAAYIWGKPLIEKRTTMSEFNTIQDFILELNDKIIDIANSGSGKYTIDIPFGSIRALPRNPTKPEMGNSLIFEHIITQPIVLNATIPIKTSSLRENATYGQAKPRMITMSVYPGDTAYDMQLNLHYRELDTNTVPRKGFLIELVPISDFGKKTVTVSFGSTETLTGRAANRGDLIITKIKVELV